MALDPDSIPHVSAVMPCLNEARTLATCIRKAQACFAEMGVIGEVVIADNGSADDSVGIATELGARVIHETRKGYGAALMAGLSAARGRYVVMADADDSYDWLAMAPFVRALEEGADLVIGNRFRGGIGPGAMPPLHRYLGNPVLTWIARLIHRAPLGDFHCGMRALRRDALDRMGLATPGMEFATEMIVNAVQAGLVIREVPTTLVKDGRDRAPHLRSFRDGWRHLRFILMYAPDVIFVAPGALILGLGLLLVALLAAGPVHVGEAYLGIHFLALGSLLTLVGFNVLNFGILAKVLGRRFELQRVSWLATWAMGRYAPEVGLAGGGLLAVGGLAIDLHLVTIWMRSGGAPMEHTVHQGFVATLMVVLGINLVCGAFLLALIRSETGAGRATGRR